MGHRRRKKKRKPGNSNKESRSSNPVASPHRTVVVLPRRLWGWAVGGFSLVAAAISYFAVPPSLQFELPSSAIRSANPYTALFGLTNTGWWTASGVQVHCLVKDVEYPGDLHSSNLPTVESIGTIPHQERRTFNCPQFLSSFAFIPKALTPDEARQLDEYERTHNEDSQRRWIGPDLKFVWIDLQFTVTYSFLGERSDTFRVVGNPNESGAFVWEQVPFDRRFDEAHKHHPEWGDR